MTLQQFLIGSLATGALACGGRYPSDSTTPVRQQTAGTVGEESAAGATGGTGMQDRDPEAAGTREGAPDPQTQQPAPVPYPDPNSPPPYPPDPAPSPTPTPDPIYPESPAPPPGSL